MKGVTDATAPKLFYLNDPGGSVKTYLYKTLLKYLRSHGVKCLPIATTGIASTLMEAGRTAHSGFGIPFKLDNTSISPIQANKAKGKELIKQG